MLQSMEGIYQNGKIELREKPRGLRKTRVIVTFLAEAKLPATQPKLSRREAAALRAKLAAWEEDWNAPGMDAYDTV
jgi:hypothetical protein